MLRQLTCGVFEALCGAVEYHADDRTNSRASRGDIRSWILLRERAAYNNPNPISPHIATFCLKVILMFHRIMIGRLVHTRSVKTEKTAPVLISVFVS